MVILDADGPAAAWATSSRLSGRLSVIVGDAGDPAAAEEAVAAARERAGLRGWVNNAALFRDVSLHGDGPGEVLAAIGANLAPAVVGSATAVGRFAAQGGGGSIVNVSSHQASRPATGALAYATAKAAIEGFTRAMAVEYGPVGVRVNAVALGSIDTERYRGLLQASPPAEAARIEEEMARLHPLGRIGTASEVAAVEAGSRSG